MPLSDTARSILTEASQHSLGIAAPPATLPAAARHAVLRSLLRQGLVAEQSAPGGHLVLGWRRTDGSTATVLITNAGRQAIGYGEPRNAVDPLAPTGSAPVDALAEPHSESLVAPTTSPVGECDEGDKGAGGPSTLTDCDREVIHIPGAVQAHGVLLVVSEPDLDLPQHFRHLLAAVHLAPSLTAIGGEAVRHLRSITGFGRIMLYRFLENGAGEVIAEDRRDDLEPFLGLRYPASDIPAQARRLFVLNPLRVWAGTDGEPAPMVPVVDAVTAPPLDMSRCVLRAASPIHLEYLRNMGVGASMGLSIVRDGALWGLIACHHMTARRVPHAQRIVLEALGHLLAVQIEAKEREERSAEMVRLQAWTVATLAALGASGGSAEALRCLGLRLLQFVKATGAAVHLGGRTSTLGMAPDAAMVAELANWLGSSRPGQVVATDRLSEDWAVGLNAPRRYHTECWPCPPRARAATM
ncbi:GAF domain-containing protein [Paeniroseomonas aquatica]|uniref:GAF domain-containing protein n=1 Tax=Paeniroseomonas aquatica TaxID=373043 RepID=A0ABT8A1L6_9PROT|nr:GAF domain-containing protein [Paeniroseomonas aquatica]MDN3563584.1 GAF domain-containing protein [Paeniroseomonas aquatica]